MWTGRVRVWLAGVCECGAWQRISLEGLVLSLHEFNFEFLHHEPFPSRGSATCGTCISFSRWWEAAEDWEAETGQVASS